MEAWACSASGFTLKNHSEKEWSILNVSVYILFVYTLKVNSNAKASKERLLPHCVVTRFASARWSPFFASSSLKISAGGVKK